MPISAESTSSRIILNISDSESPLLLQRADYKSRKWLTYADGGFFDIAVEEDIKPLAIQAGDFIDSFGLSDGLLSTGISRRKRGLRLTATSSLTRLG